jgi:hypothetical protein
MTEIKLYKSSWKGIRLIALSLPFVLLGLWMISKEQKGTFDYIMGWCSVSFFGLGIPLGIFVLFDKRPQIIINENGVFDSTLKQGEIKWEQIIEAYPIDIHNQKFISIVVNDTFEFKERPYKWAEKLNKLVGAQKLNLNLSQIKIDEIKLTELINKIINSEKNERQNHIRIFLSDQKIIPNFELQNYLVYLIILFIMIYVSIDNITAFMSIMILAGLSAIIARWYRGTNNKSTVYKYARVMTFLGFITMVALLLIYKVYDFASNKIGIEINNEIVLYKNENGKYPNNIKDIREKLNLNLFQNFIADKIHYQNNGNGYVLKLETLNHNQKEFNSEINDWH